MKLTRETLKQIIKEELEEITQEKDMLQEGTLENFVDYLRRVMSAKSSTMTEAQQSSAEVQQKVSDFKKKIGSIGMGVIKGAGAMGLDMTLLVAIMGYKYNIDPEIIPAVIGIMTAGGGVLGAIAGKEKAHNLGITTSIAKGVKDRLPFNKK